MSRIALQQFCRWFHSAIYLGVPAADDDLGRRRNLKALESAVNQSRQTYDQKYL